MISFDPATHTYTRNQQQYTSVTTLLKYYNLTPDYGTIPAEVLQKAAQRGNITHKAIEDYIKTKTITPNVPDLDSFIKYTTARGIDLSTALAEEIIYDDNYLIAGTIDFQYSDNGEEIIADHKTTSQIHYESVSWQLSIYNYIKSKGDVLQYYLKKLKVLHYHNGKLTVLDLPPIEYDEVVKLLEAHRNNLPYVYSPDFSKILSPSEGILLKTILSDIEQCESLLKELQQKKVDMQEKLLKRMEDTQRYNCRVEGLSITRTNPIERNTVDLKLLKAVCEQHNIDIQTLYKTTTSKPQLRITKL